MNWPFLQEVAAYGVGILFLVLSVWAAKETARALNHLFRR
jgi:hypothetical protein